MVIPAWLSTGMERLKKMFGVFEQRTALLRLLESSTWAEGVQIFIGGDSSLVRDGLEQTSRSSAAAIR
ncbi:hypothetical protein [Mycobacterium tuberculosis]|uniref:hypothetical protein n=1 Tax=Mycobacterium tuberculosis TaxID=1773 RepID=UPI003510506B